MAYRANRKHWFFGMSAEAKKAYLAAHPKSSFGGKTYKAGAKKRAAKAAAEPLSPYLTKMKRSFESDRKVNAQTAKENKRAANGKTPAATVRKALSVAKKEHAKNNPVKKSTKAAKRDLPASMQKQNSFKNTSTTGGVKLLAHKGAAASGMGGKAKAPTKFKNTKTTGGVKLVKSKKAAHMG